MEYKTNLCWELARRGGGIGALVLLELDVLYGTILAVDTSGNAFLVRGNGIIRSSDNGLRRLSSAALCELLYHGNPK